MEDIKGSVTIILKPDNTATLVPPVGKLDRAVQTMQWTLVAPRGTKFADPGIVFNPPPPLPPNFMPWPGSPPVRVNDFQYRADVNTIVPDGPSQFYRYDIWVDQGQGLIRIAGWVASDGTSIDPDMENQPQP